LEATILTAYRLISPLFVAAVFCAGCGSPSDQTADIAVVDRDPDAAAAVIIEEPTRDTVSADEAFEVFLEEVFQRELADSPMFETRLGIKTERYGQWDDFSDAAAIAENERRKADLERLSALVNYDALDDANKISYDIFVYRAEQGMRNFEFRKNIYVAHHLDGVALYLPVMLQNQHSVENRSDAEAYISRLDNAQAALNQLSERLAEQTRTGIVAPEFVYPKILADLNNLLSGAPFEEGEDNSVYADFRAKVEKLELGDEATADLLARAAEAMRGGWKNGYLTFRAAVEQARDRADGNDGVWEHPNGAAYYDNRINNYTTLDLEADAIHQLGLEEVARIQAEIAAIQGKVGFEGSLVDFFQYIRDDPNNYYPNTDEGREQFLDRQRELVAGIYKKVDTYFNLLPKAELDVRRVEPYRENTAGIAFYNVPSADGSRPGIYYTNLRDMTAVQKYVHTAIAYHESAPGHHFQLALQQEMESLPSFRKYGGFGSYIEGWALYSELLAKEMGFYSDPLEDVGRLQNELWRAVRLVVDTGLHTKRWTREQAIEYFLQNTPLSVGDATTEIERYIARPGQALSYKIGMLKIQELRARAESELGARFDIREFHDEVLRNGAVPLPTLERVVGLYIARVKAGG
jgi:uncharacterized protein (DUF885 family)